MSSTKGTALRVRKNKFTDDELRVLKKLGRQVNYDMMQNSSSKRPVERLSFDSDISRAAIYEITGGRGNPKLITLYRLAKSLGYKKLSDLLTSAGL